MLNLKKVGVLIDEYDLVHGDGLYNGFYKGHEWVYFYNGDIYTERHNTNDLIYTGPTHETWISIVDANMNDQWETYFRWYLFEGDDDDNQDVAKLYQRVKAMITSYNDLKDDESWSGLKMKLDLIMKGEQTSV